MAEWLEIAGVNLHIEGAWKIKDLAPLLNRAVRGGDRKIPGVAGVTPHRRRRDVFTVSLELMLYGRVNNAGAPWADGRRGLYGNSEYLIAQLIDAATAADGTRAAVLHLPDGTTRTGNVHVAGLEFAGERGGTKWRGILRLSIPAGQLVAP